MSTLLVECPICKKLTSISLWLDRDDHNIYGMENAPCLILSEANRLSRRDQTHCIHCGISMYIQLVYAAQVRVLSDRDREGWKFD